MGLFDQLAGQAINALGGQSGAAGNTDGHPALLSAVMDLINQHGGVAGLLQKFQDSGLAPQVASWIGAGANAVLSSEQVKSVLGADVVAQIAQKAGLAPDAASSGLALLLPQLIDHLTPHGQLPEGNDLVSQGLNILKGKLFG
ncbi:YidB family protein [Janthinobacterium aquaticum]|uniref:YidB family protein n=1 Tax=Janthinobacterium sp. FT58W TaxID=2654254 RepID=UPI0012649F7F|nr:YidB family protein [Janthinobacterium sp. FT58W]KAB8038570.1 DUF937 domain-containing protein [Janthinobacterium sp. FT58W]